MDDKRTEESAKDILSNSKLTIEDSDFNVILMNKIRRENKKKILLKSFRYYSIMFIGIDILIITLLSLFDIGITDIPAEINKIFELNSEQLIPIYFTCMIVAILLIKLIWGEDYHIGKMHQDNGVS
jgi:hypothetical protein